MFGAFSGARTGAGGGGDGGFLLKAFSRAGIGLVCTEDGGFLFGAFSWALGRAPKFWKYKLQVVDSSMRCESRHFKTSLSLRAPAQSLCASGPHDARRALPIVGGELPTVTGAAVCVAGLCALGLEALARLSTGSGFKSVAEPFGFDFDELAPAVLARRTQALSSAHARLAWCQAHIRVVLTSPRTPIHHAPLRRHTFCNHIRPRSRVRDRASPS